MAKILFGLKHKGEVSSLMSRLGLTKGEALDFLFQHYNNNVTFKDYFKKYIKEWVKDGENGEGRVNALYTMIFPKRYLEIHQIPGKKDLNWEYLVH